MAARRVGQRIHVYWADETAWFSGIVHEYDPTQGFYVVYDDGDERWEGVDEIYRFDTPDEDDQDAGSGDDGHPGGDIEGDDVARAAPQQPMNPRRSASVEAETDEGSDDNGDSLPPMTALPKMSEPPRSARAAESVNITDEQRTDHGDVVGESSPQDESEENDEGPSQRQRLPVPSSYPPPRVVIPLTGHGPGFDESDAQTDSDGEQTHPANGGSDEDDGERSMASTTMPTMHERRQHRGSHEDSSPRRQPPRGVLSGLLLRATDLPDVSRSEGLPSAFVRVAFVEGSTTATGGGRDEPSSHQLMLRCKQVLSATTPASASSHPIWNHLDDMDDVHIFDNANDADGLFQLQVAPPLVGARREPAWSQLRGHLLWSLYHEDISESRRNVFVGQASVALSRIMRELLLRRSDSAYVVHLPIESRQGQPLTNDAELVVAFRFQAEAQETKQTMKKMASPPLSARSSAHSTSSAPNARSDSGKMNGLQRNPATRTRTAKAISGGAKKHHHVSSSEVNRRRFEKHIEMENKAMAKRVAESRRPQQRVLAPTSEAKLSRAISGGCSPSKAHKATSEINRRRFHEQIKLDNQAMGKRLTAIAKAPAKRAFDEPKDFDDADAQDKDYRRDRRQRHRDEKDYVMEKAQEKYQQQSRLVEEVMDLQEELADVKARVFQTKTAVHRLEVMNKKDAHVRDCLRRAAGKSSHAIGVAPAQPLDEIRDLLLAHGDDDDPTAARHRAELQTLVDERDGLEVERDRLRQQSTEVTAEELALEDAIVDLHRKWHFVQTKREFQLKISATPRLTPLATAMAAKKAAKELSPEEEEQHAIYKAEQELNQLQIATTVLRQRLSPSEKPAADPARPSAAACEYLKDKIERRRAKITRLEAEQNKWRTDYEALVVRGEYDRLRQQVQELQHLLFLCQSEAKHVIVAERAAKHAKEQATTATQRKLFAEQTETEILLKKK